MQDCVADGRIKEAIIQLRRFFETVIDDSMLYGTAQKPSADILASRHCAVKFLAATLCLYADDAETALRITDEVLTHDDNQNVLYVKSRCLARLGRYEEADAVNTALGNDIDLAVPDAKSLYMIAVVNELHTADPGLLLMQKLLRAKPRYDRGIAAMRSLMKRRCMPLSMPSGKRSDIEYAFNSDIPEEEFLERLKEARKSVPKSVQALLRDILRMDFAQYG